MALINCPECGKEVSDSAEKCIHCGYEIKASNSETTRKKKINKKVLIPIIAVVAVIVIVFGIIKFANRATGLEANAKKYIKELESIVGDVEVFDVVCFSYIPYGEEEIEYKYLIEYKHNGREDFAVFLSDPELGYIGNGYNGGSTNDSMQESFNNMNALTCQKTYLEYLIGDEKPITKEDAANNKKKGLIPLDMDKIN